MLNSSSISNASSTGHLASGSSNGDSTLPPCSPKSPMEASPGNGKLDTTASSWGYDPTEVQSPNQSLTLHQSPDDTSTVSATELLANLSRPRAHRSTVVPTSPLSDCSGAERRDTLVNTAHSNSSSRHCSPLVQLMYVLGSKFPECLVSQVVVVAYASFLT